MSSKKSKTAAAPADWSLVPHGPVSAAAVGSLALAASGAVGSLAQVSPVWAAAGTGIGALGAVLEAAHRDASPATLLYRLGCWVGAGGWLSWAWWADQALTPNALAALGAGAVGAAALAPLGRIRDKSRSGGAAGTDLVPVNRPGGVAGSNWEARFLRVCRIRVEVVAVRHWDNGAGYDVVGQLPPGPATIAQIAASVNALATDARLPDGCGVEPPRTGAHRGEFVLPVSTTNMLGARGDESPPKALYPAYYGPRSLLDPVELGVRRDGSVAAVSIREDSMLIVGPKGGGKTNALDVTTTSVGRCRDALVWHLDLNGGGMSQFWLHPWLEGSADRPAIDWAAPNPEEALLMVTVAVAIAKDRKSSYRTFKARNNVKLLPISPELPAIVLMVDEGAEALSPANRDPIVVQIREGLEELLRIGRNEAVFPHFSALRPTQGTISPDVLNGCAWRLGMFGTSAADLGHLYEWPKGLNAEELPVKGTSFIAHKPAAPAPMKLWYLEPEQIQQAAAAISQLRPELDEASAEVANARHSIRFGPKGSKPQQVSDIYAGRYARMHAAFTGQPLALPAGPVPEQPAATTTPTTPALRVVGGTASAWPDLMPATKPAAPAVGGTAAAWPDLMPAGRATATAARLDRPAEVPGPLGRVLDAFRDAGDDRMHSETLAAALGMKRSEMAEMLREYGISPLPHPFSRGGNLLRGYARADVLAAVDQLPRDAMEATS